MELEKSLTKAKLITLLEELIAALKSDAPSLELDANRIQLSNSLIGEIEYEESDGEAELEIELSWSRSGAEASDQKRTGSYELFQGKDGQWYFNLKSANQQIILSSEGYASKANAQKGIEAARTNAQTSQFEHRTSAANQPYFVLKAKNGEVIGRSQMYRRKAGCDKGIRSVIANAQSETGERA